MLVYADDWTFERVGDLKAPFEEITIHGQRVHQVPVRITQADSTEPVQFALLQVNGTGDGVYEWNPEAPFLRLPAGSFEVVAVVPSEHPQGSESIPVASSLVGYVELDGSSRPEPLDLELRTATFLRIDVDARAMESGPLDTRTRREIRAHLTPAPSPGEPGADGSRLDDFEFAQDGYWPPYVFSDLKPGPHVVALSLGESRNKKGINWLLQKRVDVLPGANALQLVVPPVETFDSLVVEVQGLSSNQWEKCDFAIQPPGRKWYEVRRLKPLRRDENRFRFLREPLTLELGEAKSMEFVAIHPSYGRVVTEVTSSTRQVVVSFEQPASLVVRLRGPGALDEDLEVELEHDLIPTSGRWSLKELQQVEPATWRVNGVQPNAYNVIVTRGSARVGERAIELRPGPNELLLDLTEIYDLIVELPPGHSVRGLNLIRISEPAGKQGSAARTAGDRVVFADLQAGEYTISSYDDPEVQRVRIPSPPVMFAPKMPNASLVSISDGEGTWPQAGLQDGDLIVGMDDEYFDSVQGLRALFRRNGTWIVRRGGHELRIEAPKYVGNADRGVTLIQVRR